MTGTIIPLRLKHDEASALADFDVLAAELLIEGQAPNLLVARFGAILTKLRGQRVELALVLADLEARAPSHDVRINGINADLHDRAREGLAQIDLFIFQAEICRSKAEQSRLAI
ncbi:hypothetical protein MKL09_02475 [Methylobacterium sp. J-048]|uniref:hypothetical protein n=1 Tax=Methylobacterium sp. J-048 TaxID=2836635 RepID=UPI001FBBFA20|nr:hypothetical protein [Methylobacterium sp. J-048]MCJ2055413.1 hypothetical protein [Methylobacterium sp. J-048]